MSHTIETLRARYVGEMSSARLAMLEKAIALGAEDAVLEALVDARRTSACATIVLPAHRLENLSRGRGWVRKGKGNSADWGERVDGGYRVGPGRWTVGGNDGFHRKGEDMWEVKHLTVGPYTWTVAS